MARTSMARTFYVKANLNELNELNSSLWRDEDRAAAFMGLCCGCTGAECPSGVPDVYLRAWGIGAGWRAEAEAFRATKKNGGLASAREREAKYGTSQPARTQPEHMVEPRTYAEHMPNTCSTDAEHSCLITDSLAQESAIDGWNTYPPAREPAPGQGFDRHPPREVSPIGDLDDSQDDDEPVILAPITISRCL